MNAFKPGYRRPRAMNAEHDVAPVGRDLHDAIDGAAERPGTLAQHGQAVGIGDP